MTSLQGEVVEQQFGEQEVAFRTLDLYTSAVLEASLNPAPKPEPAWRDIMKKMSEVKILKDLVIITVLVRYLCIS